MKSIMPLLQSSKQYIERLNQLPNLAQLKPEQARSLKKKTVTSIQSPLLQRVEDVSIVVRDGSSITIRIYKPKATKVLPVIVYYHGGGWVINDINTSHESCVQLAYETEHIVVSVDYRLAPEYKFPTPLYDAFDAFEWVVNHYYTLGATKEISVAGDSAGGNLAAAVSILAAEQAISVKSQLLLYPVVELSYDRQSYFSYGSGFGLNRDVMKWFGEHYITSGDDANNPLISPLLTESKDIPPTFIVAAQYDVLYDEAVLYKEKLEKAGIPVQFYKAEGLVHSYFTNNDIFEAEITDTIHAIQHFLLKQNHNGQLTA